MAHIVVVEDEPTIAEAVAARLRSAGHQVSVAVDGPGGVELCNQVQPDLVVLDLLLPGFDGLEVCRQIQSARRVPVLMLTALDDETDLLVGLRVGADDYLTKPFSPRELVARAEAILRRAGADAPAGGVLRVHGLRIDVDRRLVDRDGLAVHLTPTEFDLLATLVRADGGVRTREQLLVEVWGYRDGSGPRTVDSHIRSLRRKVGDDVVRTVHGVGYAIKAPAHEADGVTG